jgi:seryl-tRNA synthetase
MKNIKQKELNKEEKGLNIFIQKTSDIKSIKSVEDLTRADEARIKIKNKLAQLEEERKEITKPINDSLKVVNDRYKTLTVPLKELKEKIENMILEYRRVEEEKRLAEEERLIEISGNPLVSVTNSVPEVIETRDSKTTFVKKWVYETVDIKKVPRQYLMIDDSAVKEAISSGKREIKGLHIFQKDSFRDYKNK